VKSAELRSTISISMKMSGPMTAYTRGTLRNAQTVAGAKDFNMAAGSTNRGYQILQCAQSDL